MDIANYEAVGLALFALLSVLPVVPVLLCGWRVLKEHHSRKSMKRLLLVTGAVVLLYGAVALDAFWIEPNSPRLTTISLTGPVARPIRILHLSDLHLEETPKRRDDWLVKTLQTLNPDLILVTGDTHLTDNHQTESLRRVLSSVKAPLGVYHCTGYDNVAMLREAAPHMVFLENESAVLEHGGGTIGIAGLLPVGNRKQVHDAIRPCDYRIALNHTPDLAEEAAREGVHLYLCGHTHGGQVRIPGWGAIITNSKTGKRFEAGLNRVRDTWIYTSRSFGLEPRAAPQARFFCRPEITLFQISGDGGV